jgi:hypothetical protein
VITVCWCGSSSSLDDDDDDGIESDAADESISGLDVGFISADVWWVFVVEWLERREDWDGG